MGHDHNDPFRILGQNSGAGQTQNPEAPLAAHEVPTKIKEWVEGNSIFIFMKGSPDFPQCGFSANTIGVFRALGKPFKTFDVLRDPNVRQGVKEFSNWPTIPQIYIKGQFIGGNDIVTEMYETGELQELVADL